MMKTSIQSTPSIVFSHGIWADGSCFQKLIPTLRAEGHEVMAAQYGLDTLKGDVDANIRPFGRGGGRSLLRRNRHHARGYGSPRRRLGLHRGRGPGRDRDVAEPAGQI